MCDTKSSKAQPKTLPLTRTHTHRPYTAFDFIMVDLVHVKSKCSHSVSFVYYSLVWKGWARNVIKIHRSYIKSRREFVSFVFRFSSSVYWQAFLLSIYHRIPQVFSVVLWHFPLKSTWENPTLRMCNLLLIALFFCDSCKICIYAKLKWTRRFNFSFRFCTHNHIRVLYHRKHQWTKSIRAENAGSADLIWFGMQTMMHSFIWFVYLKNPFAIL